MKRVKGVNRIIKQKEFVNFIDRLNFLHIFLIWVFIVLSFGFVYYFFQNESSFLFYSAKQISVDKINDAIYFSFVTATTTGFGDIIPFGLFKLLAIFEVVFGLLLLAVVTSKLVSIKQDMILNELYESSINERISKIRSSLLLFRQHLDRIVTKIEDKSITKRELGYISNYISSFNDNLKEIVSLITKKSNKDFNIEIDLISVELIFNSVLNSFEKLDELIIVLNQYKIEWKNDSVLNQIHKCIHTNEDLFDESNFSRIVFKEVIENLSKHKKRTITKIKDHIKN